MDNIVKVCRHYNVNVIMGDAGGGALANNYLQSAFGLSARQVQYKGTTSSASGKPSFYWNKGDRYIADRTAMIDHFLAFVKNGGVSFANRLQMAEVFRHVLSVYEDTMPATGNKIWRRTAGTPDDALHAMIYGWMAANLVTQNPAFMSEVQ